MDRWVNVLMSWLPFVLLVGFWIWFTRQKGIFGKQSRLLDRNAELFERQVELLERVAIALEKRNDQRE